MSSTFLVELADGTLIRKDREALRADDRLVFDGPGAFSSSQAAQAKLEAEIEAAGGLDAWKALGSDDNPAAATNGR